MYNSEYVRVKPFKHIGQDERGVTSEFSLSRQQQEFVYITRKKGTISGNSYHMGTNIATNPKTFILLSGEIELSYRYLNTNDEQNVRVSAPALIEIKPQTIHAIEAFTDIIILECNAIADIQQDVFKEMVCM
jgi:hypothetical protein